MSTVTSLGFNIASRYDDRGMKQARKSMGSTQSTAAKMGKALKSAMIVGGAAVVAVGAEALKSSIDFERSMTKIQTQGGQTAKGVASLSKQILDMKGAQQGPQELADSLLHLKLLGMDNVGAMKALRTASDLAAASGADLEETTNALGGAWRTGIKGTESYTKTAATAFSTISAGNATMDDFNNFLGTGILPSAKTFGLSLQSMGAAMALFTDEGVDAASAGTRLRMTISLLGAPSKAAEKQLAKIGLTGTKLADDMRSPAGLVGAVGDLKKHLDDSGLSATASAQLLSRAFGGGRSSSAILSMINNFDVLELKEAQINKGIANYGPAVERQRKTAAAQIAMMKAAWESLMVRLGSSGLLTIATKSLDGLNLAMNGITNFVSTRAVPAFGLFRDVLKNLVPEKEIANGFNSVRSTITNFVKGIGKSTGLDSIWAKLNKPKKLAKPDKMVTDRPYGTIAPSGLAYGGAGNPYGNSAATPNKAARFPYGNGAPSSLTVHPVTPYGSAAASNLKKGGNQPKAPSQAKVIAGNLMDVFKNLDANKVGALLGKVLGKAFMVAMDGLGDLGKTLINVLSKIDWTDVGASVGKNAIGFALGFLAHLGDQLFSAKWWSEHWKDAIFGALAVIPIGKAAGILGKLFGKIPILGKLLEVVEKLTKPATKLFDKLWGKIWGGIKDALFREFPALEGAVTGKLAAIGGWITKAKDAAVKSAGGMMTGLGRAIGTGVVWLVKPFVDFHLKIISLFSKAGSWLVSHGGQIVSGLTHGIGVALKGIGGWLKKWFVDPIVLGVKRLFGIASPSTVFRAIGNFLVVGLKNGILATAKGIGSYIKAKLVTPVLNVFPGAGGWLKSRGGQLVTGLKNGVLSVAKGIGGWIRSKVVTPQLNAFAKAGTWLKSAGSHTIDGLKGGIVSKMSGIATWVNNTIVKPVVNAVKKFFGIHSPSTVFHGLGTHMVTGLMNGLATNDGKAIASKIFGSLPKALGHLVKKGMVHLESLPGKAMKALGGLGSFFGNLFGGGGGNGGSGVQRWRGLVQQVLAMLGQSQGWTDTVLRRMNQESGGNPNAINLWDSNAKAGHPSQGLMQTIPGTFNAYAGPFKKSGILNPLANIYAGVNYALHQYGSLAALNRPGGYASGTRNAAEGMHWVGENGPELRYLRAGDGIMSHSRSMAMTTGGSESSGGVHYHVHFDRPVVAGNARVAEDMVVSALRSAQDKGRIKKGTVNQ